MKKSNSLIIAILFLSGSVHAQELSLPLWPVKEIPNFIDTGEAEAADTTFSHRGSFRALLGENPPDKLLLKYSTEKQIKEDTPPTILIHSADDTSVPVQNSIAYFQALMEQDIPAEMHIYPYGGHGFSLAIGRGHLSTWTDRVIDWIFSLEMSD